jgi:hypothetical protein
VDLPTLRDVIARWFFMAHATGRYTSSAESQIESDLLRLRDIEHRDGAEFCRRLDREVATVFTNDYWVKVAPSRTQGIIGDSRLSARSRVERDDQPFSASLRKAKPKPSCVVGMFGTA